LPTLELADTSIHFVRGGSGAPPLVFVHGALCEHSNWRYQFEHFANRHEVVALDLHAHGKSRQSPGRINVEAFAADLVALCRALGLQRVVLIGHSMGCRVLLQAWLDAPELVAALVCVDGAYLAPGLLHDRSDAERAQLAASARARAAALYAQVEPAERVRHGFAQMFFDPRFDAERDAIMQHAMRLPSYVARELMPAFASWDVLKLEPALASVRVPMLVFASTWMNNAHQRVSLQPGVTTPWLEALRRHAPQAELHRHHGRGHFLMLEKPAELNAEIEAFLRRHGLAP